MKNEGGWISIHRKITKNWIWDNAEYFRAWIYLLMKANHSEKNWHINNRVINIKRGEVVTSLQHMADDLGWSKSKVNRYLKRLENDTMVVTKATRNATHLSICQYETYQNVRNAKETATTRPRHGHESLLNNVNKDNKEITPIGGDDSFAIKFFKLWVPEGQLVNPPTPYERKDIVQHGLKYNPDIEFWKPYLVERQKRIKAGEFHHTSLRSFCGGAFREYTEETKVNTFSKKKPEFRRTKTGLFIAYCPVCGNKHMPNDKFQIADGPSCHRGRSFVPEKPVIDKKHDSSNDKQILTKLGLQL